MFGSIPFRGRKVTEKSNEEAIYQNLPIVRDEGELGLMDCLKAQTKRRALFTSLAVLTLSLAIFLIFMLFPRKFHAQIPLNCGTTVNEAKANGCHFEAMLYAWIPDECYYRHLDEASDSFGDAKWFFDAGLHDEIKGKEAVEDLRSGNLPVVFTPGDYHAEHCFYVWRKLVFALETGKTLVDTRTGDLTHEVHCMGIANDNWIDASTRVDLKFFECLPIPW